MSSAFGLGVSSSLCAFYLRDYVCVAGPDDTWMDIKLTLTDLEMDGQSGCHSGEL